MEGFSYRQADEHDIPLIRELASKVWFVTYDKVHSREQLEFMYDQMYSPDSLTDQMRKGKPFFLGYSKDNPIGYFSIEQKEENFFYLHKLYLLPSQQGTGAGKFLFSAVVEEIRKRTSSPCIMELNVNRENPAIGFYERMGMKRHRESDEEIGNGFVINNCYMQLKIEVETYTLSNPS